MLKFGDKSKLKSYMGIGSTFSYRILQKCSEPFKLNSFHESGNISGGLN